MGGKDPKLSDTRHYRVRLPGEDCYRRNSGDGSGSGGSDGGNEGKIEGIPL